PEGGMGMGGDMEPGGPPPGGGGGGLMMPEGDLGPGGMGDEVGAPPAGPIEPGPAGNAPEVSTERLRGMPTASKTASILEQLEREKRERMATNRSRYPRREVGEGSSLRIV